MPYPEEAEGFQVDGPETWTTFHKRYVGSFRFAFLHIPRDGSADWILHCVVPPETIWRLW